MMTRRQAIKTTALASATIATMPGAIAEFISPPPDRALLDTTTAPAATIGPFVLPPLPYACDALEPFIDGQTMQIHHDKHHAAYVVNLNKAMTQMPSISGNLAIESLLQNLSPLPENIRPAIRNQGGGHYNHSLFWQMMKKNGGGTPTGELAKAIDTTFGNFSTFKENFSKAALGQFGSGWVWLVLDGKELKIEPTANQDTPLSSGKTPLLGLDVWEHAYYLKYQNKRADYIAAWWNVANWDFVAECYAQHHS